MEKGILDHEARHFRPGETEKRASKEEEMRPAKVTGEMVERQASLVRRWLDMVSY